jgi:glycosyltransferase involved in cell wall biosynthesis
VIPPLVFRGSETPKQWDKGVEPLRFLTMADARSSLSRKNPIGAVKAFRSAFPNETDVELTVKLHKTDVRESAELRRLLDEISQDSRIRLIDRTLERNELEQLLLSCHSFVSLHRAEGFGLPILEAQTFGLATIVTGWSGNLDFTNDETSLVIPYTMTTTHDTGNVYGRVRWADPDLQSAARAMRKLYDSPGELARIAAAGWNAHRPERQLDHFAKSFKSYVG